MVEPPAPAATSARETSLEMLAFLAVILGVLGLLFCTLDVRFRSALAGSQETDAIVVRLYSREEVGAARDAPGTMRLRHYLDLAWHLPGGAAVGR